MAQRRNHRRPRARPRVVQSAPSAPAASARASERILTPLQHHGSRLGAALPGLFAAAACGLAWFDPDYFGFDLLRIAAPLFFLELPLAIVFAFADAWRVPDQDLSRRAKFGFVVVPAVLIGALCTALFDVDGLVAVAWLGGSALWRLLREGEDRRITGRWLCTHENRHWVVRQLPDRRHLPPGTWVVPMTDSEFLPGLTFLAWLGLAFLIFTGADVPFGGATPDYAAAVGWTQTPIGSRVPAHEALAAGVALFLVRVCAFFGDPEHGMPVASIESDAILREIVANVERKKGKSR